jgi:hypothetical protein
MLYLTERLNFFRQEQTKLLIEKTNEISKIIRGLIKVLVVN